MRKATPLLDRIAPFILGLLLVLAACYAEAQNYSPFMALGNAQFFDNNGQALTAGVLYSYQAGTTTQQATFTDYTGAAMNPNPIPFGSGARVSIWLSSNASYKFVLCLQDDGAYCAPSDVLFSVDHVPGSGGTAGGSPYIGTFISGSPNPANAGILELASTDAICWRNTAGTTNLCVSKDSSDILTWTNGIIKLPAVGCSVVAANYYYLCAGGGAGRFYISNNGVPYGVLPTVATAATPGHHASYTATGYDLGDLGGIDPVATQVTYSATPTFTATSQDQLFGMNLTGNVTSSTLVMTGMPIPSLVTFTLAQDATGGRTFVFPPNTMNPPTTIPSAPLAEGVYHFVWDGVYIWNVNPPIPPPTGYTQIQMKIVSNSCNTASSAYANCSTPFTWPLAFADANYALTCSASAPTGNYLTAVWWGSKTATGATVFFQNGDSSGAFPVFVSEIDCIGVHP